jgi:hypothetical protein
MRVLGIKGRRKRALGDGGLRPKIKERKKTQQGLTTAAT